MSFFKKNETDDDLTPSPKSYNTPRPLTASAQKLPINDKKVLELFKERQKTSQWQEEAWDYFDLIGEIKYAAYLVANTLSRINLYVGYVKDSATVPDDIDNVEGLPEHFAQQAQDILYLLESSNGGTSGILRSAGLNLFVAGECWLVQEPARFSTGEPAKWSIRSIDEIVQVGNRKASFGIKPSRDAKPQDYIALPPNGFISRIWRNHPRFADEADSSLRGVLDSCDNLLLLGRLAMATAKSRLNAGMLFVPDGISNLSETEGEASEDMTEDVGLSFEEEYIDSIITPIQDVSSAAAAAPLLVRGPSDMADKIKHITFARSFDAKHTELADRLLERILSGLDVPKDIAAGMANVKYSNAIIIEEQMYKGHIEPLILMIADCLTIGFLRPALRAQGYPEEVVNRAVVWYDPTAITAHPSKAESAMLLFDKGAISKDALRRAHGFADTDAPGEIELLQKIMADRGILPDDVTNLILETMIPDDLKEQKRQEALAQSAPEDANKLNEALAPSPETTTEAPTDTTETASPSTLLEP